MFYRGGDVPELSCWTYCCRYRVRPILGEKNIQKFLSLKRKEKWFESRSESSEAE